MKLPTYIAIMSVSLASGCAKSEPKEQTGAQWLSVGDPIPAPFFVNPAFPGGSSILKAARSAFPESAHIVLYDFWLGSDAQCEYAMFFVGREIQGGFESTYFRDLIFAKRKEDADWSRARVFDWPDAPRAPFGGPIELLELKGEEFGEKPIQPVETTQAVARPARLT